MKLFLVLVCIHAVYGAWNQEAQDVLTEREGVVKDLASSAEQVFMNSMTSCPMDDACDAATQSLFVVPTPSFGDETFGTTTTPMKVSINKAVYKFSAAWREGAGDIRESVELQEICASKDLTSICTTAYNGNLTTIKWTYYGGQSVGQMHMWPGTSYLERSGSGQYLSGTCNSYDPRFRPWYAAAASGPKDVVLILDTSGSMSSEDRLSLAVEAANAVLDTLTFADFVQVVTFDSDSSVSPCGDKELVRATEENKICLRNFVDGLEADGGTNFNEGFNLAFDVMENSGTGQGSRSQCGNSLFIFLTDGAHSGTLPLDNILDRNNDDVNVRIFTYTLGDGASESLPKQIACENGGIHTHVEDGGDLRTAMASYFNFYASHLVDEGGVRWSEPYDDAMGLGWMVTGSIPVYNRVDASQAKFMGVAGTDVLLTDFPTETTKQNIYDHFLEISERCPPKVEFTEEYMAELQLDTCDVFNSRWILPIVLGSIGGLILICGGGIWACNKWG